MLNQAIERIPEDLWSKSIGDWYYSMTVYHIIETAEFYAGKTPDGVQWGSRAGYNWEEVKDVETEVLPLITKDLVSLYQYEIKLKLVDTLKSTTYDTFSSKDDFYWFDSILEKFLYLQRHSMHHIGELFLALRVWDCDRGSWR